MGILISLIVVFIASVVITRASDAFEVAADYLGRNLTDGVKGATINAIGSSMPELFTTFIFLVVLNDADGFAGGIGTTAGSAIFNGMIIPALVGITVILAGVAHSIKLSKKVILRDGLSLILCELGLIFLLNSNELNVWHGVVLMAMYVAYVAVLLLTMTKKDKEVSGFSQEAVKHELLTKESSKWWQHVFFMKWLDLHGILLRDASMNKKRAWLLLAASTALTGLACHWLVEACVWLGSDIFELMGYTFQGLGLPIYFLSVIIASAATSLPDTILSLKDAKKGNYNDAVSNALGSNIFDICFALGLPLFIYCIFNGNIVLSSEVIEDVAELRIFLLLLTGASFFIFYMGKNFGIVKSIMLFLLYVVFVFYILGDTLDWEIVNGIKQFLIEINKLVRSV